MTMDPQHPLDERLAAYADGDADVLTDATLRAHVTSCERCALVVRDLGALRSALADLPDLVPSRPLRFVPPVEAPAAAPTGFATLVRRLFAPALVAGAVLVVAGSVGMAAPTATALLSGKAGAAAASDMSNDSSTEGVTAGQVSPPASAYGPGSSSRAGGDSGVPVPQAGGGSTVPQVGGGASGRDDSRATPAAPMPWLAITIIGAAIVIASLILRWAVLPAAGTRSPPF
jgi:anti-sigma factor RsiW